MLKYKVFLSLLLIFCLQSPCIAGNYTWHKTIISGDERATDEKDAIIIPGFGLPYGVAVSGNHRVWTSSYNSHPENRKPIFVYDPQYESVDTIGPFVNTPQGTLELGLCRFFATLNNGNIAYGDWSNDKILVFDQDTYNIVLMTDSSTYCNLGGGLEAFYYQGDQYYLTQRLLDDKIIIWDSSLTPFDTLYGSPGGRNLAATENGSVIISPSLGENYLCSFSGNPIDGYILDTLYLEDLGIEMGNIMYVSLGPQDYFWLFSRDSGNDGIYVVDPYYNFEIKKYTNTDPNATSLNDFPLMMAVRNQYDYWLEQDIIDSSLVYTQGAYYQPWVIRAPCQVAWDYCDGWVVLYMADFYGYTLKSWKTAASRPFELKAYNTHASPGSSTIIPIYLMLPHYFDCHSLSLELSGFLKYGQVTDVERAMLANFGWEMTYHLRNDTLIIDASGNNTLQDFGLLLNIIFQVSDTTSQGIIPVNFANVYFDGEKHYLGITDGSISVSPGKPILNTFHKPLDHHFGDVNVNHDPDTGSYDIRIINSGEGTLIGDLITTAEWIIFSQNIFHVNKNDSVDISVVAQTASLSPGDYKALINVNSNGGSARGRVYVNILSLNKNAEIPSKCCLHPNYPNPFNPQTVLGFELSYDSDINISIYDINGRKISTLINEYKTAGQYQATFNASDLESGIYFYRMLAGDFVDTKKMIFIK